MKHLSVLLLLCMVFLASCTFRDDVQCTCHANGQSKFYDMGIHTKPTGHAYIAACDTLGAHDGLDTCNLIIVGD